MRCFRYIIEPIECRFEPLEPAVGHVLRHCPSVQVVAIMIHNFGYYQKRRLSGEDGDVATKVMMTTVAQRIESSVEQGGTERRWC